MTIDEVQAKELAEKTDILDKQIDVVIASADGTVELRSGFITFLVTQVLCYSPIAARSGRWA